MELSMELLKKIRDKTGVGIADCKKALEEANGDVQIAEEILRKKGIAKAAKRGDRETSEGIIKLKVLNNNTGYIIELSSETDFVARNEKFLALSDKIIEVMAEKNISELNDLLETSIGSGTIKDEIDTLSGIIGEKIELKRVSFIKGETVVSYSHMGGRIGVLVSLDKIGAIDLGHDIAMQIAASNPKYLNIDQIPEEEIAKEKEIYREQLKQEGKPDAILEKIIAGKLNKYYEEVCLLDQEFIKDDSKKVKDILGDIKINGFIMFNLSGNSIICKI